jgi:hypothetical protein
MTNLMHTLQHIGNVIGNITQGSVLGDLAVGVGATIMGFIAPV